MDNSQPSFLIVTPLVAKSRCRDWASVIRCLQRSVVSVGADTQAKVKHLVICEDDPNDYLDGVQVKWVDSGEYPGNEPFCPCSDKGRKIIIGFQCEAAGSADYVMILDADDLVSHKLFSYIRRRPQFDAFCFSRGWEWEEGEKQMTLRPNFHRKCGSSHVWRFSSQLFPAWLGRSPLEMIADQNHADVAAAMLSSGVAFEMVREPLFCYVKGHGQNLSDRHFKGRRLRRIVKDWLLIWRRRRLDQGLGEEFGLAGSD